MSNPFGQALLDHYRGEREDPLLQRDGETVRTHPIEDFYFGEFGGCRKGEWIESWLEGPLLDMGAGAGRESLHFQERFGTDRFRSALAHGTQLGLAKTMRGLRSFFEDLAHVTTGDATAVVDCYDPTYGDAADMLGFRADPTPGLAFRVLHFEYGDDVGETLLFRLFSPDRLCEAAGETGWSVAEIHRPHDAYHYLAALEKA